MDDGQIGQVIKIYSSMQEHKRAQLVEPITEIQASIDYIDWKQGFYDDVLAGRMKYFSNLVQVDET